MTGRAAAIARPGAGACPTCAGLGYVLTAAPSWHQDAGKMDACPTCTRLAEQEYWIARTAGLECAA